jgi:hypothetical protein
MLALLRIKRIPIKKAVLLTPDQKMTENNNGLRMKDTN